MTESFSKKDICEYISQSDFKAFIGDDIEDRISMLSDYVSCIVEWGKSHNIVSRKINESDLWETVLDSIIGGSFLSFPKSVVDAGSGGGFPAIVLAILYPDSSFTLVESNRKKCSFLRSVKATLGIKNVSIENTAIQRLSELPFVITKAAFSPANSGILPPVLSEGGILAIWTTPADQKNFEEVLSEAGLKLKASHAYSLPNTKK